MPKLSVVSNGSRYSGVEAEERQEETGGGEPGSREAKVAHLREAYRQGALKFDEKQVAERLVARLKLSTGLVL